jgi:hypothetical protein
MLFRKEATVAEYEFEVVEPMVTENIYYVTARTRAEALAKVLDLDPDAYDCDQGSVRPTRPMTVRDVKRRSRVPEPDVTEEAER